VPHPADQTAYDDSVATLLDPFSYDRATHLIKPGARCLQIGAGTFAGYLAHLVGPDGHVTAIPQDAATPPSSPTASPA
jgi:hypothetical protein